MDLLNGNKMMQDSSFWNMWTNELPCSFPKLEVVEELSSRWGITVSNAYKRLKSENFMSLKSDLGFLFNQYGIAFDCIEKGFYLDRQQYDLARQRKDLEAAQLFGLSK